MFDHADHTLSDIDHARFERNAQNNDFSAFERLAEGNRLAIDFVVPSLNCAGCMSKIENHFRHHPNGVIARVNLGAKKVHFEWPKGALTGRHIASELESIGFKGEPLLEAEQSLGASERELRKLIWCMAVAGFAAANVMLLSVSVWSGASGATRDLFHWISALIALPAIVYAGQPFFTSAFTALRARRINMDVPISLAVILAGGLSLYETITHGEHAFFDAAVTLLFFLLIGRTLDQMMRAKAHMSVHQLLALKAKTATIMQDDALQTIAIRDIQPGMVVFVRPGETIPADGSIIEGRSDIEWSMVTGESVPQSAARGDKVYTGLLNISAPLHVRVEEVGDKTLLAEIVRLMETAQNRSPHYRKLADRAAAVYAPSVHIIAALTFLAWLGFGAGWQAALFTAISVLIITCPCALGLAVPVVQVTASGIAFKLGVLMKDGAALEKLSEIDTVVFDKTGTLTLATPILSSSHKPDNMLLSYAFGLAQSSNHPLSKALVAYAEQMGADALPIKQIIEHAGLGLEGTYEGHQIRLGSKEWCGIEAEIDNNSSELMLWVSVRKGADFIYNGFKFEGQLAPGVKDLITELKQEGLDVHILSGDREQAVAALSTSLGIKHYQAEMKPGEKADYIERLNQSGAKVLMVGDGINDGPSLKMASVSLSPAKASDVAQVSASFVLIGEGLQALMPLYRLSQKSSALIWQNFALALLYNLIAVPIAVLGFATPIVAAIAMSLSSLIVTLNGMRLNLIMRVGKK